MVKLQAVHLVFWMSHLCFVHLAFMYTVTSHTYTLDVVHQVRGGAIKVFVDFMHHPIITGLNGSYILSGRIIMKYLSWSLFYFCVSTPLPSIVVPISHLFVHPLFYLSPSSVCLHPA